MPHRTYRRLGHRALGLLPFGRDERAALVVVFVGVAAVQGLAIALGLTVVCAIGILAHRQSHRGRLNHLRAAPQAAAEKHNQHGRRRLQNAKAQTAGHVIDDNKGTR